MKMENMRVMLVMMVYLAIDVRVDASADVVKTMSLNYVKALQECKKEKNLSDAIDADFNNYWKLDFTVTNREVGCAVICLSGKLELLTEDNSLHHGNAKEFAMTHGADEEVAQKLVDTFHQCEKSVAQQEDECLVAVGVVNCFKLGVHRLEWAPDLEVLVGEVLAEI